jgi:hypothetical protein
MLCVLLCIYESMLYQGQSAQQLLTIIKQNMHYYVNITFLFAQLINDARFDSFAGSSSGVCNTKYKLLERKNRTRQV